MKNNIFLLLFTLIFSISCTDDFEELNTNRTVIVEQSKSSVYFTELIVKGMTYNELHMAIYLFQDL